MTPEELETTLKTMGQEAGADAPADSVRATATPPTMPDAQPAAGAEQPELEESETPAQQAEQPDLGPLHAGMDKLRKDVDALRARMGEGQDTANQSAAAQPNEQAADKIRAESSPETIGQSGSKTAVSNQRDTESFKEWFQQSAVTDQQGQPLRVFHGTPLRSGEFNTFDMDKTGSNIDSGFLGKGAYFTTSAETASYYAKTGSGQRSAILPAYLSLQNPFNWGEKTQGARGLVMRGERLPEEIHDEVIRRTGFHFDPNAEPDFNDEPLLSEAIRNVLIDKGYDGVRSQTGSQTEYVAFHPEQIKSATGNKGTFGKSNPDIRMAHGGQVPGPGDPHGDNVRAMLSPGEVVLSADAARQLGPETVRQLEAGKLPEQAGREEAAPWREGVTPAEAADVRASAGLSGTQDRDVPEFTGFSLPETQAPGVRKWAGETEAEGPDVRQWAGWDQASGGGEVRAGMMGAKDEGAREAIAGPWQGPPEAAGNDTSEIAEMIGRLHTAIGELKDSLGKQQYGARPNLPAVEFPYPRVGR